MHAKSDNNRIIINDKADEALEEPFESLCNRYQNTLKKLMKSSEFVCNYVYLLYYKCHKINPNCHRLHTDSPDWIKIKKATVNFINKKDNTCF